MVGALTYLIPVSNLRLKLSKTSIANQLYFDSTGMPAQAAFTTGVTALEATNTFRWRTLRLHNHILLQTIGNDEIISVPSWASRHVLYFEGDLFKRALHLQAGVDLRYHAAYFAPRFDPITSQFIVQRMEQTSVLPMTEVFVTFFVKKARVFLALSDATEGLLSPGGYFVLPGYPAAGRVFRFGVSWQFFD